MTRGHEPILTQQLLARLEADEDALPTLGLPEPIRQVIAAELTAAHRLAWRIDEARRTGNNLIETGRLPGRVERENDTQQAA